MKILLVEDNRDIAGVIYDFFEMHGHKLDYAVDGKQGLDLARKHHYDVIVLDVMLPGISGTTVCANLRAEGVDTPILMLTARDQNSDILEGFSTGADDYLVKPFDLNILEARLTALNRRRDGTSSTSVLHFGDLTLDLSSRVISRNQCRFKLNQTLFSIAKMLMLRAPKIVTREELISAIWQDDEPDTDILRSHIYQLRNKVDKPFEYAYIRTVPKVGYQLVNQLTDE
jgi:DNA-binding response OmpR family regulator